MSRNYIASWCPRCTRELASDGECYDCPNPPAPSCHCCGRDDVELFPYEGHVECNRCSGLGDELAAERVALLSLLARVAVLTPTVRRVVMTSGVEKVEAA